MGEFRNAESQTLGRAPMILIDYQRKVAILFCLNSVRFKREE